MGKSAMRAAVPAPRIEPIRKPESDAFARAVELVGGLEAMSLRSTLTEAYIETILFEGVTIDADACPMVERAARMKVTCEDIRPDLIWHRDGAGEVFGYSCAIDGTSRKVLEEFLASPSGSKTRKSVPIRHKADVSDDDGLHAGHWADFAAAVEATGGVKAFAELSTFSDKAIHNVIAGNDIASLEMCWELEKATGIRCEDIRGDLIIIRDASGAVMGHVEDLQDGIRSQAEMRAAIRNILGRGSNETRAESSTTKEVLSHLFGQNSHGTWWRNIALTQFSDDLLAHADDETARTIANSCENILYAIEHGVTAGNKVLWSALQSGWTNTPEVLDLTYFLSTMGEYAIELRGLKSNLQFQLKDTTL